MHTTRTAKETLEFLWTNYLKLSEQFDLDSMPPELLDTYIEQNPPVRPFRIATWLTRQGFFIAAWSLWEYFARNLCQDLPNKVKQASGESTVEWVGRLLAANNKPFSDQAWFVSANCLRNLIAHNGARVAGSRAEKLLERTRVAFPEIETWQDGYFDLKHDYVAELAIKVEDFISETAR